MMWTAELRCHYRKRTSSRWRKNLLAAKPAPPIQDFLTLLKDADPDIPILKQAQAEYAKLQ